MAEHRNVAADTRVMRLRLAVIADLAVVAAFRGMNVGSGRVASLRTALVPMMRHRPGMRTRALMAELGIVRSVPVVAVARVVRSPARMGKDRPMPDDRRRQRERGLAFAGLVDREIADLGRVVAQQRLRYDGAGRVD